jgi:3-oxoacyl-[acyl-carrier-protein] synthase II
VDVAIDHEEPGVTTSTRRRVVVTGLGVKAPGALAPQELFDTLRRGIGQGASTRRFDASEIPVTFACEVEGFEATAYVGPKDVRRLDRATQLAIGAGIDAVADAGELATDPARCAVVAGTGLGGLETTISQLSTCIATTAQRVSPLAVPMLMPNASAANLAMLLGWTGPNFCVTTACASGGHAIGEAARLIREGSADVVLAGGTESCLTPFTVCAFWRMGVLSLRNHAPVEACRPFDAARDGLVLGEGSGFLVLEEYGHATARGANVLAELAGYGRNCDAIHVSSPASGGTGAAACIELALDDAGLRPSDIGHINAHGTATELNDQCEAQAIEKVFGPSGPPITAPKGVLGHLLGAAGAVEAVASIKSLQHNEVPPTANFERTSSDMAIDVVAGTSRVGVDGPVLSTSFGFGGHNAALIFRNPDRQKE